MDHRAPKCELESAHPKINNEIKIVSGNSSSNHQRLIELDDDWIEFDPIGLIVREYCFRLSVWHGHCPWGGDQEIDVATVIEMISDHKNRLEIVSNRNCLECLRSMD